MFLKQTENKPTTEELNASDTTASYTLNEYFVWKRNQPMHINV
jgi:hypothetical protein